MSASSQRTESRPEGDDRGGSERDNHRDDHAQSAQGEISTPSDRSDFHPPRSRTPTSSRLGSSDTTRTRSHETQPTARNPTVRWPQRSPQRSPRRYEGDAGSMPDIFSPPRSGKVREFLANQSKLWRHFFKAVSQKDKAHWKRCCLFHGIFFVEMATHEIFSPFTFSRHLPTKFPAIATFSRPAPQSDAITEIAALVLCVLLAVVFPLFASLSQPGPATFATAITITPPTAISKSSCQSRLVRSRWICLLLTCLADECMQQSTPRATNASSTMESNHNQSLQRNDNFTVDLESVEFPPDVLNLPMGSFTEDSPPRGNSSDSDGGYRRRASPRASPIVRQPPTPLYHDSSHFASSFPASSPSPEARRAAAESQYSYYPEPADWYSPPPIEHSGHYYEGGTPQRSPIRLTTPGRGGSEFFSRTPSRPAPFPFEGSPSRDAAYDLINTPKAVLGNDLSPVDDYDESIRLGIPDQHLSKLDFGHGDSERKAPPPSHGAPPMQSPLSAGFLQDFVTSPMGELPGLARSPPATTSTRRATGPYGRHPYVPMPPFQPPHPPLPRDVPPSSTLKASPVVSQESRSRKSSWSHETQGRPSVGSTSGVRVELGSSGKPLERINEWMRAQTSTPSSHRMPHHPHYPYHPHYAHHHHHMPPRMPSHYPFHARRTSPSKTLTPPPHEAGARYPYGATDKKAAAASSKPSTRPRSAQGKPVESKTTFAPKDKENETQAKTVVPPKRNPCNCKKSRCLKLYCECFSAELFCDGCNCTDCCNNEEHQELRDKAMKETRSKNPKAFQPRLNLVSDNPAQSNHSMGCRCKKSECLKKYCECFQAGVFCAGKCKCKSCANFAGSQKLIDKRRKMKDVRGAQIAMRAAEEAWKGPSGSRKPPGHPQMPPASTPISSHRPPAQGMMRASPDPRSSTSQIAPRPHYMGQSFVHHPPKMSFSPLGVVTPGYPSSSHAAQRKSLSAAPPSVPEPATVQGTKRPVSKITPSAPPRTPAVRLVFDPSTSRKRRKKGSEGEEATFPYFGSGLPEQPKTTALAVFSFLSNEDVYKAALVSKTWKALAEDGELWQFP